MNPSVLYIAPFKDFSGYAEASRNYLVALHKAGLKLTARSLSYDGGQYTFTPEIAQLFKKPLRDIDIVIQQTTPNETERKDGLFNVNYFAWETDRVPGPWVENLNKMDLVLVPCRENMLAARKSGVIVPIEQVPHTFDVSKYKEKVPSFYLEGKDEFFKMLSICQVAKKKGLDALLKAYFTEFTSADKTILMVKVYFGPRDGDAERERMLNQITKLKEMLRLKDYPRVILIHQIMSEEDIKRLHATSDCYVLPSRGEGWSIPHFDAMGYGKPPIAVGWGGPTEFITKDAGWLTKYMMGPVHDMPHPHDFMYTGADNWAEPDILDVRAAMRQAYREWQTNKICPDDNSPWNKRIAAAKARAADFSHEIVGPQMKDIILHYFKKAL
jgi:glycosyltransferase involved in cell wall biosynthesis